MAIQGTQASIYTNTYCFCIFFFNFFYIKQNKIKLKTNKQKHVKQNTQSIKTRLTQKQLESKTNKLCKNIKGEREKVTESLFEPFFFPNFGFGGRSFLRVEPLFWR